MSSPRSTGTTPAEAEAAAKTLGAFKHPGCRTVCLCALLACMAGMVNAIAFRNLGSFVSHATGSTTKIGMYIEGAYASDREDPFDPAHAFLLVLSFMIGAMLCGTIFWKNEAKFGKKLYGIAFISNSLILVVGAIVANLKFGWAAYILAAACGLQNGVCTVHWGPTVRTTHVTGLATDLGLALGRMVHIYIKCICGRRGHIKAIERAELAVDRQKVEIFLILWSSFLIGAIEGSLLESAFASHALLVPAAIIGVLGVVYTRVERGLRRDELAVAVKRVKDLEAAKDLQVVDSPPVLLGNTKAKATAKVEKLPAVSVDPV